MEIRLYKPIDRCAVRQIAYDTADGGRPGTAIFSDCEMLADLLTVYYTDFEPASLWVADCLGEVVGYLLGSLNRRRYFWVTALILFPRIFLRAILRGAFFKKMTWQWLAVLVINLRRGGFIRNIPFDQYPAHLHINIKDGFRGQDTGRLLIERFIEQVRTCGLLGIHASVSENNLAACSFFEKLGFIALSRHPMVNYNEGILKTNYTVIYGRKVV